MRFDHFVRPALVAATVLLLAVLIPGSAAAQSGGPGLRAGVSGSPDQFYFGGHFDTGRIAGDLSFRPNIEVGVGDNVTTLAGNFEFVYWFPLRGHGASVYAGGGPAVNFFHHSDNGNGGSTDTQPGFNVLVGLAHRGGLFGELKVGFIDSPEVKFGVGYTWK
jgi:hypothetical protein